MAGPPGVGKPLDNISRSLRSELLSKKTAVRLQVLRTGSILGLHVVATAGSAKLLNDRTLPPEQTVFVIGEVSIHGGHIAPSTLKLAANEGSSDDDHVRKCWRLICARTAACEKPLEMESSPDQTVEASQPQPPPKETPGKVNLKFQPMVVKNEWANPAVSSYFNLPWQLILGRNTAPQSSIGFLFARPSGSTPSSTTHPVYWPILYLTLFTRPKLLLVQFLLQLLP